MIIKAHELKNDDPLTRTEITNLVRSVSAELAINPESVQIIFTDNKTISELHRQFMNDSSPTDVITFNLGEGDTIEGEIYISREMARDNASYYKEDVRTEFARLIIHGIMHLAGYDDSHDVERIRMKTKENEFVEKFA